MFFEWHTSCRHPVSRWVLLDAALPLRGITGGMEDRQDDHVLSFLAIGKSANNRLSGIIQNYRVYLRVVGDSVENRCDCERESCAESDAALFIQVHCRVELLAGFGEKD